MEDQDVMVVGVLEVLEIILHLMVMEQWECTLPVEVALLVEVVEVLLLSYT